MDSKRKGDDLDDFYRELSSEIGPAMPPSKVLKTEIKPAEKPVVERIIASKPVKYYPDEKKASPPPMSSSSGGLEPVVQTPAFILYERAQAAQAPSYQQALKLAHGNKAEVQYVFGKPKEAGQAEQQQTQRFFRKAAQEEWEDPTLADWDPNDYRAFVGNLGNEVNDDVLLKAFLRYPSLQRVKVVRDKKSGKTRGFGFISFRDAKDFAKAMKEMNGRYVGNRPCVMKRSDWQTRAAPEPPANGKKKS